MAEKVHRGCSSAPDPSGRRGTAALALLLCAPAAHALERVTLQNGFTYDCLRQERLDPSHVRLIFSVDAQNSQNSIDLPLAAIAAIEPLPDPPPATAPLPAKPGPEPTVRDLLAHAGSARNLDVELLASVVAAESAGNPHALSRAGAQGLMQLMPSTARSLGVPDGFSPEGNVNGGALYLDRLLTRYHENLALALAAYNAGPAAVDRFHGIPPFRETRAYVLRVLTEFKRRKAAGTQLASR